MKITLSYLEDMLRRILHGKHGTPGIVCDIYMRPVVSWIEKCVGEILHQDIF